MEEEKKSKKLISSSMVDLKAELYRKQEEFKKQKKTNATFIKANKSDKDKKKNIWSKQNPGVSARAQNDLAAREIDVEEEEMLAKSRRILEQKARVYESFRSSSTIPEEDGSEYYLVDFQKKAIDALVEEKEADRRLEKQKEEDDAERKALAEEIPEASCPEDEWIDFMDSLGRDRRCMKKDLSSLMRKDQELALAQAKKKQSFVRSGNDLELDVTTSKETSSYKLPDTLPHLMSSDMHREMMRQKWESEANELLERGQDEVHYSNVQFDEIRAHGVGFYQFSKDHSKRQEELEKLQKLREETKDQQSSKEKVKDKRKAMMEARLAKVRQRRKLKGEVKEEDKPRLDEADKDSIGPKLNEALLSSKAEEDMKREEENKEAEEKRKNHVREWDKEKMESNTWGSKNYVAARRKERDNEFAPPSLYFDQKTNTSKLANSPKTMSNTDRLNRLKESISLPAVTENHTSNKDKNQQLPPPSAMPFVEKNSMSTPSDPIHSIPVPEGPRSTHCEDHSSQGQPFLPSASHAVSASQPPINTPQHQQYTAHSSVPQCYSGEQASSSWPNWNPAQSIAQYQQNHQYMQDTAGSQDCYPVQHNVQQYQPCPSGPPSQGWNYTQSAQPLLNHPATQYDDYSITNSSTFTSSDPLNTTATPTSGQTCNVPVGNPAQNHTAPDKPPAPKKSKVSKPSVVDMRFMNNFDTSSINPEPGRVPDVGGVPYKPGTFSKYRPHGTDEHSGSKIAVEESGGGSVAQESAQISGGPLIYTKEQLERQQKELDDQEDNTAESDDDRKLQDFLSSIRASSN